MMVGLPLKKAKGLILEPLLLKGCSLDRGYLSQYMVTDKRQDGS